MTKDEIVRKKQEYLFNCVTTYFKDPMVIDHAKGQYVWDIEGKQFLDFLGGIVTVSVGHSNPKVTDKIKAQIDKVQHTSTLFITEAHGEPGGKSGRDCARQTEEELFHQQRHGSQ